MNGSRQKGLVAGLVAAMTIFPALATTVVRGESIFIQEGRQLYEQYCSRCHGPVDDSAKAGRSMTRIRSAIRIQPTHRPISLLSDEDILLIAMALREGEE